MQEYGERLAHLVEQLGPLHADEARLAFVSDRLGEQRLPAAWWAPQKHACRRVDPNCAEELRSANWLYDGHVQLATSGV